MEILDSPISEKKYDYTSLKQKPEGPIIRTKPTSNITSEFSNLIEGSIDDLASEDGYVFLGNLGNLIIKKQPDFDPHNYGFKKIAPLIQSIPQFDIQKRSGGKNVNAQSVYIRVKDAGTTV